MALWEHRGRHQLMRISRDLRSGEIASSSRELHGNVKLAPPTRAAAGPRNDERMRRGFHARLNVCVPPGCSLSRMTLISRRSFNFISRAHTTRCASPPMARKAYSCCFQSRSMSFVLDLGLPELDGIELCRRHECKVPRPLVLMVTARSYGARSPPRAQARR